MENTSVTLCYNKHKYDSLFWILHCCDLRGFCCSGRLSFVFLFYFFIILTVSLIHWLWCLSLPHGVIRISSWLVHDFLWFVDANVWFTVLDEFWIFSLYLAAVSILSLFVICLVPSVPPQLFYLLLVVLLCLCAPVFLCLNVRVLVFVFWLVPVFHTSVYK